MRIALVVHDFSRGVGHGRYTFELARRFVRDHDVHVFANGIDRTDADGVQFHHVPAIRSNALATIMTFPLPATLQLGRDWDIIHAQGALCARFNVITAHICNAGWADAQRTAEVARTWRQRVFEQVVTRFERAVYRRSPRAEVIAISRQLQGELARYYGRRERVGVIHHGVDITLFTPSTAAERLLLRRELSLPVEAVTALFIGDLRKGAAAALDAVARAPGVHLVLVSRSDPSPYVERARTLGIADRVSFRPAVATVEQYYRAADLFFLPTPYDAFGMVISEAMACGIPVITSRQAGASELITDGVSGFVVDRHDDTQATASHLVRLAGDAALRASMGREARRAAEHHTWDDVAAQTMRVYERAAPLRA